MQNSNSSGGLTKEQINKDFELKKSILKEIKADFLRRVAECKKSAKTKSEK